MPGPDEAVSALDPAAALDGSEIVPVTQSGTTVRTTTQDIADLGGGGSGTSAVAVEANGPYPDFDPAGFAPSNRTSTLLVNPDAQNWQANTTYVVSDAGERSIGYPSYVHAVGDDSVKFSGSVVAFGTSGGTEPVWSTDDETDDGNFCWQIGFTYVEWSAEASLDMSGFLVAGGFRWTGFPTSGTSGASEPDWASASAYGATLSDGDFTYTNAGPITTWQPNTDYGWLITSDGTLLYGKAVLPTVPAGLLFVFNYRMGFPSASSGGSEPTWDTASGHYTRDDELIWVANANPEKTWLTGIAAPIGPAALLVVNGGSTAGTSVDLPDLADVEGQAGENAAELVSADANQLDLRGSDYNLGPGDAILLTYFGGLWHFSPTAT